MLISIVRRNLSSELGFSKRDRELNIIRIGFVASEISNNGGVAICAPIAAIAKSHLHNRVLISKYGGYIEEHIARQLDICEKRDRKGLYAKAKAGIIKGLPELMTLTKFPKNPELALDTTDITPDEVAEDIFALS